jgi:hypothetical protein
MATDLFHEWLGSAGRWNADGWETTTDLFDSYCAFHGEPDGGIQEFSRQLHRYLVPLRRKRGRGWRGFSLGRPAG